MIKAIIIYAIAIFVGNFLANFVHLLLLPLLSPLMGKEGALRFIYGVIPATAVGIAAVIICTFILRLFSIEPNNYLVWILFGMAMLNDIRRLQTRKWSASEFGYIAGDALGIFLGALILNLPY